MNQMSLFFPTDQSATVQMILSRNELCARHSLHLTAEDAKSIAETHAISLRENELVEIGAGSVDKIITEFAASPYADRENFAQIVETMTEVFCYLKREANRELSDTAVIAAMREMFDEVSCGCEELFLGRDLDFLLKYLRQNRLGRDGRPDYKIREEDNYGAQPDIPRD